MYKTPAVASTILTHMPEHTPTVVDSHAPAPGRFDTKVVVVLDEDLLPWQELNVTAFLMSAITTSAPDLFATSHDEANRAAVAAVPARELDLVGLGLRGPRNVVDRIVKGARMHR